MRDDVARLFDEARARLRGVPREALGRVVEPGRLRAALGANPRIVRVGGAWRAGVLLIGDDAVSQVGEVLRAQHPGRRGYAAESARQRAELRAMALRGGFDEGESVNVGWREIDLGVVASGGESGPLVWQDDRAMIRWTASGTLMPLACYLDERIALLRDPPPGA